MASRLILALLSLAACEPVGVDVSFPDGDIEPDPAVTLATVEDAMGFWGVEFTVIDTPYGSVQVDVVHIAPDAIIHGVSYSERGCRRSIWTSPNPVVLAHEMGHTFGLEHVEDPTNLMHIDAGAKTFDDVDLDEDQVDSFRERAALFKAGCPNTER